MIKIGPKIEEKMALEVRACILFCAPLTENGIKYCLQKTLASPKANFLSAKKVDRTCRTPGTMGKSNSDPSQVNVVLPAHP